MNRSAGDATMSGYWTGCCCLWHLKKQEKKGVSVYLWHQRGETITFCGVIGKRTHSRASFFQRRGICLQLP